MSQKETSAHLSLANARQTEEQHLASTTEQIAEYDLSIAQRNANIAKYQDAIEAERVMIAEDRKAQAKLKKKRIVFKRAVFALDLIEQEG